MGLCPVSPNKCRVIGRGVTDQRTLAAKAALRDQLDQCIDHGNEVELDTGPVLTVLDGGVQ
jgi:hypothetical protein